MLENKNHFALKFLHFGYILNELETEERRGDIYINLWHNNEKKTFSQNEEWNIGIENVKKN